MISMVDPMAIGVKTPKINSGCSLEKEFTKLICMSPWMVLCQTVNQVYSCHNWVLGPLTWDTKDILRMNDHILTMTHESLATGSPKFHRLNTIWSHQR